jgi:hypothetical protein
MMAVTADIMAFDLSEDYLEETFLASTGPGGQNVNKVCISPPCISIMQNWASIVYSLGYDKRIQLQ